MIAIKTQANSFGRSDTVVAEIIALHSEINGLGRTFLEKAVRAGELLTAIKLSLRHGDWLKWIKKNLPFNRATAANYMRVFDRREELKCKSVLHLADAYALLAKKTDREALSPKSELNLRRRRLEHAAKIDQRIIVGDFRDKGAAVPDASISLIFTDPPYHREAEQLFDGLAQFAERVLCDGGSIVFYCGHLQLPAAFRAFANLRHWWTCANVYEGGGARALIRGSGVRVCWKPLLWFVKTTRENKHDFVTDVNITPAKEKGWHDWQQTTRDATHWMKSICPADGIVCDPLLGSGTTAIAARQLGLRWIGFEIDAATAAMAGERIYGDGVARQVAPDELMQVHAAKQMFNGTVTP